MPDLFQVQQIVRGGYLGLDSQGELTNVGRFQNRAVTVPGQGADGPRSAAEISETRTVIDKFIDAIAADSHYGPELARSARTHLQEHIETGKPLGERHIDQVLSQLDSQANTQRRSNLELAERFGDPVEYHLDSRSPPHSKWNRIKHARNADHLLSVDPDHYFVRHALSAIQEEILALGDDGKHEVTEAEAQRIAEAHLGPLVEQLLMDEILEASDLTNETKAQLWDEILADPGLNRDNICHRANVIRLDALCTDSRKLCDMASQANSRAGIHRAAIGYTLKPSLRAEAIDEMEGNMGGRIASAAEIKEALQATLDVYAESRKRLEDHINNDDDLGPLAKAMLCHLVHVASDMETMEQLDDVIASRRDLLNYVENYPVRAVAERQALCHIVLADRHLRHMNRTEDVEAVVQTGPACQRFCIEAATMRSGDFPSNIYVRFRNDLGEMSLDTGLHGLTLVGAQCRANLEGSVAQPELQRAWLALAGPRAQLLKSSAQWLAEQHGGVEGAEAAAREFTHYSSDMAQTLAVQGGVSQRQLAQVSTAPMTIAGEQDVPDETYTLLRDLGADIPRPNPLGRESNTQFGVHFTDRFLEGVNEQARKQDYEADVEGMHPKMHQEFERATYTIRNKTTQRVTTYEPSKGRAARREASNFFDQDTRGKEVVSRLANPDIFMEFPTGVAMGDGPISMLPQAAADTPEHRHYTLWQDANGSYGVEVLQRYQVSSLRNPSDGSVVETDPTQSHVEYSCRLRVDQASLNPPRRDNDQPALEVTPEVTLLGPIRCSYKFVPEPSAED